MHTHVNGSLIFIISQKKILQTFRLQDPCNELIFTASQTLLYIVGSSQINPKHKALIQGFEYQL